MHTYNGQASNKTCSKTRRAKAVIYVTESERIKSERIRGKGIKFSRIRRITGYLVGDMRHWGTGKRAEEKDRIKHITKGE